MVAPKSNHSTMEQFLTIQNPNAFGIRAPTVHSNLAAKIKQLRRMLVMSRDVTTLARTHVTWDGLEVVLLGKMFVDQKLSNIQILSFDRGKKINQKLKMNKTCLKRGRKNVAI